MTKEEKEILKLIKKTSEDIYEKATVPNWIYISDKKQLENFNKIFGTNMKNGFNIIRRKE